MRVLMLSWEYPPKVVGGIARRAHDLSHALADGGAEVEVITCDQPDALGDTAAPKEPLFREDDGGECV